MNIKKTIIIFLILFTGLQSYFAQDFDYERNWYKDTKGFDYFYSGYDFTKGYTKDDVRNAINKYHFIKSTSLNEDEWEGFYATGNMLGYNELYWNSAGGFVRSYVYHTLSSLDYGSVKSYSDSVTLISQMPSRDRTPRKLIKVKYGDRHYLVPENTLEDFTKKAVGLTNDFSEDTDYYCKVEDEKKKTHGIPILPKKYKNFERSPIEVKVIKVAKPKLNQNKHDDGTVYSEYFSYEIMLDAGRDKEIKKDFQFFVKEINEWFSITSVSAKTSKAEIIRYLDDSSQEICNKTQSFDSVRIPGLEVKNWINCHNKA